MKKISIIIPSYNRLMDLQRCISSILSQDYKDYEIIVVDNNSTDGTIIWLKDLKSKLKNRLKIIFNNNNIGASEARNQALRIVKSDYVLFLDSDAELKTKQVITNMINILGADSSIGQLGAEIINHKIRLGKSERNEDGLFSWVDNVHMENVDYVPTSNCVMKTSVIKKLGGFDPYYIYGYEDNDLGWRVRKSGLRCIMDDRVSAYHHVSNSGRTSSFFRFHRNRIRFLIKKEKFYFLIFLPLIDIILLFKLLPARIMEFSKKPVEQIAWFDAEHKNMLKNESSRFKKLFNLMFNCYFNLIKAYIWNINNISETLKIRYNNLDFIKNEIKIKREGI